MLKKPDTQLMQAPKFLEESYHDTCTLVSSSVRLWARMQDCMLFFIEQQQKAVHVLPIHLCMLYDKQTGNRQQLTMLY